MSTKLIQEIQRFVGARPDGEPGPETWGKIADRLGVAVAPAKAEGDWPVDSSRSGQAEMRAFYGHPGSEDRLTLIVPPYPLKVDGHPVKKIRVHEIIAPAVLAVLAQTKQFYGDRIPALKLDVFDGCFNPRPKRGGSTWSTHAFGAALDFGAEWNQMAWDHSQALYAKPEYASWWRFWEDQGALSLGRERDFDWMHIQFARLG